MSIHESCIGNMMTNFTSPYTLRPTFTQMALRPFVIVFKWLYCPSHDLIGCQNISASEKIVTYISNKSKQRTRSDLHQSTLTTSIYKSFGFHEMHLLPKTLELCVVRHMKVSMK